MVMGDLQGAARFFSLGWEWRDGRSDRRWRMVVARQGKSGV